MLLFYFLLFYLIVIFLLVYLLFERFYLSTVNLFIATDYGLDGPGSNPGGDEIFRPSSPVLSSTQPPVK